MEGPTIDKKTTTGRLADRESPQTLCNRCALAPFECTAVVC